MPRREDIQSVLVIGSGPIVIGQGCEFDYSGTQAIKALKQEGLRVVLINSNPATIMTDPEMADATYVEPLTVETVERIIAQERPDALLPTVGGQTALNLSVELAESGVLERYGVQLIGASLEAVKLAEDRLLFKTAMEQAGLDVPKGGVAHSIEEARVLAEEIGFPILIRPSFTLGGTGGGVSQGWDDFEAAVGLGLRESPIHQVLIEQSVLGWKEFEVEIMSDRARNFVIVCSIENFDPMGVHTGDSITVAPALTLTDKEYQRLRDQARIVARAVGVETGGANVQFAIDPATGRIVVIEMNPRVSRSSALASKATGFPIAKIAALVALGYTLDELKNDITQETVAAFEPSIDYVVVKMPRWGFEKFPGSDPTLGPQMKSIGEAMAIGRTFKLALQKAVRSLENGRDGLGRPDPNAPGADFPIERAGPERLFAVYAALLDGMPVEEVARRTCIDPWFLEQIAQIARLEREIEQFRTLSADLLRRAKQYGFSDRQLARLTGTTEQALREQRLALGIRPTFALVDTCAAEFAAQTPYLYSSYEDLPEGTEEPIIEAPKSGRPNVIVLGSGPNRIGQGIEFDYACCHASLALREAGYEAIMVNCNPETVSTDYDTSDRLYFEPLTLEDVLAIVDREQPAGVMIQFGGQTPLKLAQDLRAAGVPIWGTDPQAIDLAEDRRRFGEVLDRLAIPQPAHGFALGLEEAHAAAAEIGYPLLVRPSYVLGGRAMAIVYSADDLAAFVTEAAAAAEGRSILIDRYLEDAYELDVDAVADGERVVIGGILEHIEEAGVHSGDSACVLPPYKVSRYYLEVLRDYTERLGKALNVRGLLNIQYAIKDDIVYVLEVNPRASRTVPFVSKATGVPLARVAARVATGEKLADIGLTREPPVDGFFVKEAVFPFRKLHGSDAMIGPEMRSTGEVMGHAASFGWAFAKSQMGAGETIPTTGAALISVNDYDKRNAVKIARDLHQLGFRLYATHGTARALAEAGLPVAGVNKVGEGSPHTVDLIAGGQVQFVINTPMGRTAHEDGAAIRTAAISRRVLLTTTLSAAAAAVSAIRALRDRELRVRSLQDHYGRNGRNGNGRGRRSEERP
ncbi:MAG TPA: carbamoyl-phosphate synthase large subunit [Dehalococcoidia bacterium]|nr:carbamoyl-phosphate synthase large subunit [Dehalococcoidia bacterium]